MARMLSVEEEAIRKAERNSSQTTPTHRRTTTMSIPDHSQPPVRKSSHIRLFALGIIHRLLSFLPLEWLMKSFKLHLGSLLSSFSSISTFSASICGARSIFLFFKKVQYNLMSDKIVCQVLEGGGKVVPESTKSKCTLESWEEGRNHVIRVSCLT